MKERTGSGFRAAVFRSRSQAIKFQEAMRSYRIPSNIINTPRELSQGCGLSVRFDERFEKNVKMVLSRMQLSSYVGIYPISGEIL